MDNLTHSLAGAVLGQIGLKKKTGLGMATLIIAANIPDIDAITTIYGIESLAMRRGITHGPIALLLLPILLAGIMIWFDRWQERRGTRPTDRLPLHKGWLLALAYIGTISHPALDYLNNYGIRLLEPFSSKWFYGDTLFIIDVWILAMMGLGLWISFRRERSGVSNWRGPALGALAAVVLYVAANGLITNRAETLTTAEVARSRGQAAELVVANNLPITFWARQMLWRGQGEIGTGAYSVFGAGNGVKLIGDARQDRMNDVNWSDLIAKNVEFDSFRFWSRMPYLLIGHEDGKPRIALRDQRFDFAVIGDRFVVKADLLENDRACGQKC